MHDLLIAVLLGIIEGVTEFLPVSSTGHLVLGGYFLGLPEGDPTFDIVIQLGAILAVVVVYWQRFMKVGVGLLARDAGAIRFTRNVLLGFIPSMLVGAVAYSAIRALIQDQSVAVVVIAIALILGGLAILFIERTVPPAAKSSVEGLSWKTALGIGVIQCVAMIPGVSRSGATIMGALTMRVDRETAAEFSFFLAIPTMAGATTLALWKARHELGSAHLTSIAVGFVVSFLVAIAVIRWFVGVISRRGFAPFAWYRIAAGALTLLAIALR